MTTKQIKQIADTTEGVIYSETRGIIIINLKQVIGVYSKDNIVDGFSYDTLRYSSSIIKTKKDLQQLIAEANNMIPRTDFNNNTQAVMTIIEAGNNEGIAFLFKQGIEVPMEPLNKARVENPEYFF